MGCPFGCIDDCDWSIYTVCKVCENLHGDKAEKACCYCNECKKYICKQHWKAYGARAGAACVEMFNQGVEMVNKGIEHVKQGVASVMTAIKGKNQSKNHSKKNKYKDENTA